MMPPPAPRPAPANQNHGKGIRWRPQTDMKEYVKSVRAEFAVADDNSLYFGDESGALLQVLGRRITRCSEKLLVKGVSEATVTEYTVLRKALNIVESAVKIVRDRKAKASEVVPM